MHAAVVTDFDQPPEYQGTETPSPTEPDQELVEVLAAGLHPRVRSGARGAHYTSSGRLPLIPGIDGVGRRADGTLVYFALDDDVNGSMAEWTLIDPRRSVVLPEDSDPILIAAAMNPAMSSWVALRRRIEFKQGASVLVLGATGNAGSMAIQIARLLGAGEVIAAGRNRQRLDQLDATARVQLQDDPNALAKAAADVDVVIDYLWGHPTERLIPALLRARHDRSRRLDWIQIGSLADANIDLPSAALRSANLALLGSGQGSVSPAGYVAELPALVSELNAGRIGVSADPRELSEVEQAWIEPETPGVRTVLVP